MSDISEFDRSMQEHWQKACAMIYRLGGRITAREFGRHTWRFRQAPHWMLATMVLRGMGRWEYAPRGAKGGRPTRVFVLADDIDETGVRRPTSSTPASPREVLS